MANHDKSTASDGEAEKAEVTVVASHHGSGNGWPLRLGLAASLALPDSGVGAVTAVALGILELVLDSEVRPAA